jgi:hypothetical protein
MSAPLMHAHHDDRGDSHHGANMVHAHFSGHQGGHHHRAHSNHVDVRSGVPEIDNDPDLVTRVQFFVADHPHRLISLALQPADVALAAPLDATIGQPPLVSHAHDPPLVRSGPPRAPPSVLS